MKHRNLEREKSHCTLNDDKHLKGDLSHSEKRSNQEEGKGLKAKTLKICFMLHSDVIQKMQLHKRQISISVSWSCSKSATYMHTLTGMCKKYGNASHTDKYNAV